jgi:chromosome segregation ATPase
MMFGGKTRRQLAALQREHAALIADNVEKDDQIRLLKRDNAGLEAARATIARWRREDNARSDARIRDLESQLNEQVDAVLAAENARAEALDAQAAAQREKRIVGKALNDALTERDDARDVLRKIAGSESEDPASLAAEHLAGIAIVQAEAA